MMCSSSSRRDNSVRDNGLIQFFSAPTWRSSFQSLILPSGFQPSQRPANTNGESFFILIEYGVFSPSALAMFLPGSKATFDRIAFADYTMTTEKFTIWTCQKDQINDGRQFLGCTRMDSTEVQNTINDALNQARVAITEKEERHWNGRR